MAKIKNDKYYTPIRLANHCWDRVLLTIGKENITEIIEPSYGTGAFYHHNIIYPDYGFDIEPAIEGTNMIKDDFLKREISYLKGRLVIGNPPYGDKMNLAKKFFKKSIEIADYVAFILPISQLNNTNSLFEFDLIWSEDLGIETFSGRKLHCCFNIYKRPESNILNKRKVS